ncbi:hypothetical protein [Saccharothrix hoggarensis]|uniref:Uncharacterized protein n=1 Tax=Saccharothrix hoggarensis TaxID=913853 RepID=A0ABW3QNI2_9PSEU
MTTFANTEVVKIIRSQLLPATINGPQTKIVYEPLTCTNILWAILGSNQ